MVVMLDWASAYFSFQRSARVVADVEGKIFAGRFVRGANLSFITIEITLQEWIPKQAQQVLHA